MAQKDFFRVINFLQRLFEPSQGANVIPCREFRLEIVYASSKSIFIFRHDWSKGDECAESKNPMAIPAKLKDPLEVTYSYSITYVKDNNVKWASRWDYILDSMPHTDIQVR